MTVTTMSPARPARDDAAAESGGRFRLHRAGVLNVWQYDEQVFAFADGRLLLRGANGAGKSKTLEILLPFALDGDKSRITASAKHHTSLLWLMTDGYEGGNRVGYVWVEFERTTVDGTAQTYTCGVGIRASASARSATAWHFVTDRRIGVDLSLEDDAGPMSVARLKEVLGEECVFETSAAYKAHIGRTLFGLDAGQYNEVLRLLYWLRQPQVGEDIEPAKLAHQLSQALPQLDEQTVRAAGDTFDELTAFGEQIDRRSAASEALQTLADAYTDYARSVVAERARAVREALTRERRLRSEVDAAHARLRGVRDDHHAAEESRRCEQSALADDETRLRALEDSPEFRNQRRLAELADVARRDQTVSEAAAGRHERQRAAVERQYDVLRRRAGQLREGLSAHSARLRDVDERLRRSVPGSGLAVPATVELPVAADDARRATVEATLHADAVALTGAASAVSRRLAAVGLVRAQLERLRDAMSVQGTAEREASSAESRWEAARAARVSAQTQAAEQETALGTALRSWAAHPGMPEVRLSDDLSDEFVEGLPSFAQAVAESRLRQLHDERARWSSRQEDAETRIMQLEHERMAVEAERDPAPPPPPLPRTARPDGLALWQLLDFADGLDDDERAALEAGLQASGLLDAWIRPGGRVLGPEDLDVVLAAAGQVPDGGTSLAAYLVPDVPAGCGLDPADVARILASIPAGEDPDRTVWFDVDGSWRLGPAHGRAGKAQAQFLGATARAGERARRLAVIDEQLTDQKRAAHEAKDTSASLSRAIDELQAWVGSVPPGRGLLDARTQLGLLRQVEAKDEADNRVAQQAAHEARQASASARAALEATAGEHDLPDSAVGLDAAEQQLRGLADSVGDAERAISALRMELERWAEAGADLVRSEEALAAERVALADARAQADSSRVAHETLRDSLGDSVQLIQRKIGEVKKALEERRARLSAAVDLLARLNRDVGGAEIAADTADQALAAHLRDRGAVLGSLAQVGAVPGMQEAAGVDHADAAVIAALGAHPSTEPVARAERVAVERLAALSASAASATSIRVWRAQTDAVSGPASDHQPVVATYGDLLTVTGRDEAGEAAVVALAARVAAGVRRDRDLLSEREKRQFEQHVLGELGDTIRRCRRDAEELVFAMNQQLGHVTTSQGIRVRLDWKLRDDVPAEARAAVRLLAQPVGALIPEEREALRDVLHRLIEASRAERKELSYGEHLAAALDYRTWSEFTIRYTRPEKPGQWDRLHRRSPLSQGEQKVLCYLPLFAAAAAHFTSLAGAAPYAPRLVLLDDAFPKIDVRTHPLLFGLLVQLDLDFVITSERLWGDHASVPALAIYEALRDPNQRGIAQYEYRWDGRVLQGLG